MLLYLCMTFIEIFFYCYVTSKLFTDFSKFRLITFITVTNYWIFGIDFALYITILNLLVLYNIYIPHIVGFVYALIKDKHYVVKFKEIIAMYKINTMCHWILILGDLFNNIFKTILTFIVAKIMPCDVSCKDLSTIDEFLLDEDENDDEQFQKLNQELNNLLSLSSNIISQTLAGRKKEQIENVGIFMSGVNTLFGHKKK